MNFSSSSENYFRCVVILRNRVESVPLVVVRLNLPKVNLFEADSAVDTTVGKMELFAQRRPLISGVDLQRKKREKLSGMSRTTFAQNSR